MTQMRCFQSRLQVAQLLSQDRLRVNAVARKQYWEAGGLYKEVFMRVSFFDFDGCLFNCPVPETGKGQYFEKTGVPYPHDGWWGRKESLDLDVFDIQPFYKMDKIFRSEAENPESRVVLLTNRRGKLEKYVRAVLDKHSYKFDVYNLQNTNEDKGQRLRKILEEHFPDALAAYFYDDDPTHLRDAKAAMRGHKIPLFTYLVTKGSVAIY